MNTEIRIMKVVNLRRLGTSDGFYLISTTSCQLKHFFQFTSENLVISFSNHLVIKTQLNTFWNKKLASWLVKNLHKSSCRDFIMSIQKWKNHETYLIFPHVLEACFLGKNPKNTQMGKEKCCEDFPQHNFPFFLLLEWYYFSKKIKNIFSFFIIYLGSSCLKLKSCYSYFHPQYLEESKQAALQFKIYQ